MLNYQDDQNRTWLLSQKPFLNLLYTSLMGESNLRDALVTSVHKQFSEIANRAKDSTGFPSRSSSRMNATESSSACPFAEECLNRC
ncbi:hypothetical protein L596_016272 [Steinernema carpocapsae]|uniref:Uncharacterized protein n=1 Tax=Steinernema carpocapsae TaxID=34508 RepID=A0A4U5NHL9_STECR|nr:hypothetical protein L596_016272 [Steinernema carpocapsae]